MQRDITVSKNEEKKRSRALAVERAVRLPLKRVKSARKIVRARSARLKKKIEVNCDRKNGMARALAVPKRAEIER